MSKRERLVSLARVISKISPGVSARPAWVSTRVASADIRSPNLSVPSFHLDRAREQNVVFQVNVLVQIGLELRQRFVQCLVADAGVTRWRISSAGLMHHAQCITGGIVVMFHHRNWVCLLYTSPKPTR